MTELDLRIELESEIKKKLFLGTEKIGIAVKNQKENEIKFKKGILKDLTNRKVIKYNFKDYEEIISRYYNLRFNRWDQFTSFCYSDRIRFYIRKQIYNALRKDGLKKVYDSFCTELWRDINSAFEVPLIRVPKDEEKSYQESLDFIINMKKQGTKVLMKTDLIADDVRIIQYLDYLEKELNPVEKNYTAVVLITNDRGLKSLCFKHLKDKESRLSWIAISIDQYLASIANPGVDRDCYIYSVFQGKKVCVNDEFYHKVKKKLKMDN